MRLVMLSLLVSLAAFGADVAGQWKASFETQIGVQNYTYDLKVDGKKVTGKATQQGGSSEIAEGKVDGNTITFVENFVYQEMTIRIEYTGKFDGNDTIQFSRKVAEFAVEDFPATREVSPLTPRGRSPAPRPPPAHIRRGSRRHA